MDISCRFFVLQLSIWILAINKQTDAGSMRELHAEAVPMNNLNGRQRDCWEQYMELLQQYHGAEVQMPERFQYNYRMDGDIFAPYCKMYRDLLELMAARNKRNVFNFVIDPSKQWDTTVDFPLRYKFYTSGYNGNGDRDNVRKAMNLIETSTCVEFTEISSDSLYQGPHIEFRRSQTCVSFVGRTLDTIPQPIYLSATCLNQWGDITHELLHTLGFWHTHQRFDRSQSVQFIAANVQSEYANQFFELPESFSLTLGKDYDYSSIMHFNGQQFSESGEGRTLATLDPLLQRTIGQRVELSYDDAHIVNTLYCDHVCEGVSLNCDNGYVDPKDCSQCRCPDGFAGTTCNQLSAPVEEDCGSQELIATSSTAYVFSHNDYGVTWYKNWQECTWRITAPGGQVQFWFEDDFGVYCKNDETCFHWVEIRYANELHNQGARFCCSDLPLGPTEDNKFLSVDNDVLVLFRARWEETQDADNSIYRRGFKLAYRRVLAEICVGVDCSVNGECNPTDGSCACHPGYQGIECAEEINECLSIVCTNGGTCMNEINGYTCTCVQGYVGDNCETDFDECGSNPCVNGQCTDLVNGYRCTCNPGYTGTNCDIDIDECSSSPCLNGGICGESSPGYFCTCPPGFYGTNCEIDINECSSEPCLNGGTCFNQPNMFECVCLPDYEGFRCHILKATSSTSSSTSTPTTTTFPSSTTVTTTLDPGECPADKWGDQCQYLKTCGGHSPGSGPGVLDEPCNHRLCSVTSSYKTCTRKWFVRRCKYKTRRRYYSCEDPQPVCDRSIGFELVQYSSRYWCAQAGYQTHACDCCYFHCHGCDGWNRKLDYWALHPQDNELTYQHWNRTCLRYADRSSCRDI